MVDPGSRDDVAALAVAFPAGRWRARWIWTAPPPLQLDGQLSVVDDGAAAATVCLRHELDLDAVPAAAPARIVADSRYVLWVNGTEVRRGPTRGNPRRLQHDLVDLAPHLRVGGNCVAAVVRRYPRPVPWWMPAPATYGLGGGAFAFEARVGPGDGVAGDPEGLDPGPDERPGWWVSGASWRALDPQAWSDPGIRGVGSMPLEVLDARRLPVGWQEAGFDDTAWGAAEALLTTAIGWEGDHRPPSNPYGALPPSLLPALAGPARPARPVWVATGPTADGPRSADPVDQAAAELARLAHRAEPPAPAAARAAADVAGQGAAGGGADPLVVLDVGSGRVAVAVLDLGEQTSGLVGLDLDAPAGARIDVLLAEAVDEGGLPVLLDQHTGLGYVARGHHDRFETIDRLGGRYLGLAVQGDGPVAVRGAWVREQRFPRPWDAGGPAVAAGHRTATDDHPRFACSDDDLTRLWQVGRRTTDLCSHDAYLDCPSREQRAWVGDSVVHLLVDLTTHDDWRLARRNVELAASPRPDGMLPMAVGGDFEHGDRTYIPDWSLHWVHALHELWRWTGDAALTARLLPVAEGVLRWFDGFADPTSGLATDVTGWVLVDWSAVSTYGTSSTVNALWARALGEVAAMSDALGDAGRARWARGRWEQIADAFEVFWDAERGRYADHLLAGVRRPAASQHAQAAAIVAGLVPDERVLPLAEALADPTRAVPASWLVPGRPATLEGEGDMYAGIFSYVTGVPEPWWDLELLVAAQPFFRYVVHDAVVAAGLAERIPALCRQWLPLLDRSATTLSEVWFGGSHCHAWSATPTRDLVQRTLGLEPAEPGWAVARVAPALGDLAWASGSVATPAGLLHVHVSADALELDTPVPADVVVPGTTGVRRVGPGRHRLTR